MDTNPYKTPASVFESVLGGRLTVIGRIRKGLNSAFEPVYHMPLALLLFSLVGIGLPGFVITVLFLDWLGKHEIDNPWLPGVCFVPFVGIVTVLSAAWLWVLYTLAIIATGTAHEFLLYIGS